MIRYFITTLALIALATQLWADEFEYDSRRLYDLCSPDQIEISEGVHFDWGHYQQWTTHPGTASGPGSFVATPWNTCCQAPVFRELRFEGQGELTFFVRTAHDGSSPGRHVSGPWSSWEKLNFEGRIARIPSDHQERQWIQVRCEMSQGAKLNQFSIHKQMILPDHPRLILTPQRVAETRQRIESEPEIKRIYDHYIVTFKRRTGLEFIRNNTNAFTAGQHMISLGVAWSLSQDAVFLEEAKRQLDRLDSPWGQNLSHFDLPQILAGSAVLIDHVWNSLTDAERQQYGRALLRLADQQHKLWRFSDVSNQIFTNSGKNVLPGLALAGANIQPEREAFYLRQAEDLIRNHLVPGSNFWAADDGGWGEGHSYCSFTQNDLALIAQCWASASGEDIFQQANFFKFLTQWRVYQRRYHGGLAKFNDSGKGDMTVPYPDFIASRWRDRIAQRQARENLDVAMADPDHWSVAQLWKAVVWYDPNLPVATEYEYPESMPLGRHFEGVGQVVSRSGWNNDDVVAIFKSGRAFTPGTHYHADENSFVIDRAGSLAIDSGSDDRDSSHYSSYFTRSVAHNTITVTQPGEVFAIGPGNDGGQIGGSWVRTLQTDGRLDSAQYGAHLREPLRLDGIIAFETTPEFTYAAGDATKAYNNTKVSLFTRQFLHMRPGCIVIFDRVTSTDAALEKRWLLHTINEPTIDRHIAKVSHQQGSLFCQTLLPTQSQTTRIGGPGKEFYVDGQNHPITKQHAIFEPGAWRIEVQPTEAKTEDYFLHFIYVADSEQQVAPQAVLIDRADQYGLRVKLNDGELEVTFHKSGPVSGHIQIHRGDGDNKIDQPLTTLVVPQRFDTEEIWK